MEDRIPYEKCPLCQCVDFSEYAHGRAAEERGITGVLLVVSWVECANCGHVFTKGYFTPEAAQKVYERVSETQRVGHDVERRRWESARTIERVLPYAASGGWLDVGFGDGSLLFTAEEFGFEPCGIEIREDAVRDLTGLGFETFHDLGQIRGRVFTVVSLMDVLEHHPFPRKMLKQVRDALVPGGVLLLSTPRRDTVIWRALDNLEGGNPYLNEIEHYHCFTLAAVKRLFDEFGFELKRYAVTERYRSCMQLIAVKAGAE